MRERERERERERAERSKGEILRAFAARSEAADSRDRAEDIYRGINNVKISDVRASRAGNVHAWSRVKEAWPAAVAPGDPTWISLLSGLASNRASLLRDPEWELASERGVLGARRRAFDPSTEPNRLSEYRARARSCRCHLIGLTSPFGFRTFVRCSSSAVCDTARTQQGRDHLCADNTRILNKCMYI